MQSSTARVIILRRSLLLLVLSPIFDHETASQQLRWHYTGCLCVNTYKLCTLMHAIVYRQGSFPAGTPGNGVLEVILTVGTAFQEHNTLR